MTFVVVKLVQENVRGTHKRLENNFLLTTFFSLSTEDSFFLIILLFPITLKSVPNKKQSHISYPWNFLDFFFPTLIATFASGLSLSLQLATARTRLGRNYITVAPCSLYV